MEHYRLWGRILSHHRIVKNETVEIHDGDIESAFLELCRRFDVQRPLQLPKHNREWEKFGRTILYSGAFHRVHRLCKLEVELLTPDGEKKHSGPRTPLMDA